MNLHYDVSIPAHDQPLVLFRGDRERVEMHLRRDEEERLTLLAFAGSGLHPEREQRQGPYLSPEQACAARRAIAGALINQGFRLADDREPAIWALQAQRVIKAIREAHERYKASYKFDPKDVYLDW